METLEEAKLAARAWLAQKEEKEAREKAEAQAREHEIFVMKVEKAMMTLAKYLPGWAMEEVKIEMTPACNADDFSFVLELEGVAPIKGDYEWKDLTFTVPGVIPGYVEGQGKYTEGNEPEWAWSIRGVDTHDLQVALALAIRAEEAMVDARVEYHERLAKAQSVVEEPSYLPVWGDEEDGAAILKLSDEYLTARIRQVIAEELGK